MEDIIETHVIKPKLSLFLDEVEYRLIDSNIEIELDKKISEIETFMANNHGFGQSDEFKDSLYTQAKILWNQYASLFKDVAYTFYLNRKQYNFLVSLLRDKLEYDVNTVFLAIELTNMLGQWLESEKHKTDKDIKGFTSDSTEITYIYHLIAKHKVKGLTADTYLFAEILRKIGDISKIINYYDTSAKNMSGDIQKWVASFEPQDDNAQNIVVEDTNSTSETIQAKKLEPKTKKAAVNV